MDTSQIYILFAIVVLLIIALIFFFVKKNKKQKSFTPLAGIAFACIISGIIFGGDRLIGYSLLGIGVLLAVIDIFLNLKKNKRR